MVLDSESFVCKGGFHILGGFEGFNLFEVIKVIYVAVAVGYLNSHCFKAFIDLFHHFGIKVNAIERFHNFKGGNASLCFCFFDKRQYFRL